MHQTIAAAVAALCLTGCATGPAPAFPVHYTLGSDDSSQQPVEKSPPGTQMESLRLAEIDAPSWLDTDAIYYRLNYQNKNRIAAYTRSDWVASPTIMLLPVIQRELAASPAWSAVIGPGNPGEADETLRIHLGAFQQDFSTPENSTCLLSADATAIDRKTRAITGQKHFEYTLPAKSADAAGGVACLRGASRRLASDLRTWLED